MLNLGTSNKIKIQIDPKEGYPKVIAVSRILQGESVETVCSHDLTLVQSKIIFSMSKSFSNCIKPNPIKAKQMNSEMDQLLSDLRKELVESEENVTQEMIDNLPNSPKFLEKLQSYRWLDFLTGNISLYTVSDFPNVEVEWNNSIKTWQVVAIREILPDEVLTLPKPQE